MPAEFNPVARVVDAYTPPSTPTLGGPTVNAGGGWEDLARSLSRFNQALTPLLAGGVEIIHEQEMAEGARIQQEHQVAFKDAVKKGLIPEGANPYMKLGYLKSELRLKGQEYHSFMLEEWQKDGAIQNADVEALGPWQQERTAAWRQQNLAGYSDVLVAEVFDPQQAGAQNQLMQHHIGESFRRTSERARDSLQTEIASIATSAYEQPPAAMAQAIGSTAGVTNEAGLRTRFVSTQVQSTIDEAVANGLSPSDANKIAIEQIGAIADLRGDPGLLDSLDHISTGSGALGGTAASQQMKLQIEERIYNREWRDEQRAHTRQDRQRSEARRTALNAAAKLGGPFDPIALYEASGVDDAGLLSDLIQMSNAIENSLDRETPEDDVYALQLEYEARTNPDFDPLRTIAGVQDQRIRLSTAQRIMGIADQSDGAKKDPRLSNPTFTTMRDAVGRAASSSPVAFGQEAINSANAEMDFQVEAEDFIAKNPQATQAEVNSHMRTVATELYKFYGGPLAQSGAQQLADPSQSPTAAQPAPAAPTAEAAPVAEQIEPEAPQQAEPAAEVTMSLPPPQEDAVNLQAAVEAAPTVEDRAAIMDAFDAQWGPLAAARVLGLIQ